jgi:hypothetical protein
MIAEAVRLAWPMAQRISVDLQTIRFSDPKKNLRYTYLTPRTGQVALVRYDQGIKPEPFSMMLRGAQVTRANPRESGTPKTTKSTEAQRKQRADALKKAHLTKDSKNKGNVPEKIGGKTPPLSGYSKRRAFGLRGLEF